MTFSEFSLSGIRKVTGVQGSSSLLHAGSRSRCITDTGILHGVYYSKGKGRIQAFFVGVFHVWFHNAKISPGNDFTGRYASIPDFGDQANVEKRFVLCYAKANYVEMEVPHGVNQNLYAW